MGEAGAPPPPLPAPLDADDLRGAVRDLAACLVLPALWAGRGPVEILGGLLDVLLSILRVDAAWAAWPAPGGAPLEERRPHELVPSEGMRALLAATEKDASPSLASAPGPAVDGFRTARRRIAVEGGGAVVAASRRPTFPTAVERFLMDAAVNQAAVALHTARLLADLRERDRVRDQQAEVLLTVNEVAAVLSAELDLQRLVQILTDAATRVTRAAFGAFFYNATSEGAEAYTLYTISGVPREVFADFPVPQNSALVGPTFRGEALIRLDDVTKDPRYGRNAPYQGQPPGRLSVRSYLAVPVVARSGEVLGGLFLGHPEPAVFTERDEHVLRGLAAQVAIALDNAHLYERERRARAEAERAGQHARFLAEASTLLASSLDVDTVLGRVARLAVPVLADLCAVDMVQEDGSIRRVATAHVDPAREELARRHRELYPFDPGAPEGVPRVIRSGASDFLPDITDAMLEARARDAGHLELLRRIGVRSAMIVPLVARGRTLGALTCVLGIGDRRYTPADLTLAEDLGRRAGLAVDNARLYRQSELARAEAEAANRAKDEFLATLSHELRTPLNAVLGWARILRSGRVDAATAARALEVVERNAEAQTQLIEDLIDMARITTGKLRLDVRPLEPIEVVTAVLDTLRPAAQAKGIRVESVLDPRAGPVSGDPGRLQQVVWNLVSNAIKFTPRHGRVQVRLQRVDSHVEIVVSDTGRGMGPELLPYIFDRFRQADSSSTRAHGGLGIGLALVKHLVELHGGTVEAESPGEGMGATFRVKLSLMVQAEPAGGDRLHPTAPTRPPREGAPSLDGVRVLVVDDDRDGREVFDAVLRQHGAEVRCAASGAEALEVLRTWPATVLLSDIEMQGQDGYALLRDVRQLLPDRGGAIPAAAITAYGRSEDRVRALAAGFQMHLPKPVEPRELVAVVANLARFRWAV